MKKGIGIILALLMVGLTFSTVFAQSLRFQVDQEQVNYVINQDGTATVEYTINFINSANGAPIDYVDIGMPNGNFDLKTVTAELNGVSIKDITKSTEISNGITLGLGSSTIQPAKSGSLHMFVGKITKVLYNGDAQNSVPYASFQFEPNYFGSSYVSGKTNLTVTLFLPPGLEQNDPRYFTPSNWPGSSTPTSGYDAHNRVYYQWQSSNANVYSKYTFGAAFPAKLVPSNTISAAQSTTSNIDWVSVLCCTGIGGFFGLIFIFAIYQAVWGQKKRKLQYLPPKISIEGHGIKRGLTAVEAAILMEQPMDKVLTMVLFSAIKKNAARVVTREPLKLEIASTLPEGMQTYETDFLKAMQSSDSAQQRTLLQDMMIALVKSVSEKMRGFSRKETVDYYDNIMKQAWAQVEAADTPDMKMQKFDDAMDWTMLDRKFEDHTRTVFVPGPVWVMPTWWGRYDPTFNAPRPSTASMPSLGGGQAPSLPSLPGSTFAASIINGVQGWSAGVLGDITGFTSGITNKTNPVPTSTSSGKSFGGSRGGCACACACACAGCACACAGGGR